MTEQKVFCKSAPSDVYRALSTPLGRERFWAGSAPESGGVIAFALADGRTANCAIERAVQDELFQLEYFGRRIAFALTPGDAGGTDVTLSSDDDSPELVSLLLRLKAAVDFGVDLRNHDEHRTAGYLDS
ncbi:hypothetical protein AB0E69_11370 [Kribbella sp. NPDC026611]|uniref:hypothetical protein n=1 Tax=Kribbella sp. NPDC026611 TaxID=3154911 RepID=UPI0033C4D1DA